MSVSPQQAILVVDFHAETHPNRRGVKVVDDFRVTDVLPGDGFHFLVGQAEIPNIKILRHALGVGGFRDNHDASLRIPSESDLRGRVNLPHGTKDFLPFRCRRGL